MTERTPEQRKAIEIILGRAPDIQDDLRNYISKITEPYVKVIGQGSRIFDFAELVGYRINNSLLDIAEDLDVKSRYGIEKNEVVRTSVGRAFRGHLLFSRVSMMKFDGLFSKELNDMIEDGCRSNKTQRFYQSKNLQNSTITIRDV
jgi:hypothetical protein